MDLTDRTCLIVLLLTTIGIIAMAVVLTGPYSEEMHAEGLRVLSGHEEKLTAVYL